MTIDTAKLKALRERYSPQPIPTCRLCGAEMSAQRISGNRITYGCTGATYDDTGCHYAPGRNIADAHYEQSQVVVDDFSDPDVIELIAALEAAELEAVKNWWKPERCPVTNRPFFLWIEHPSDGMVPTYGGPYDSYTIPTMGDSGEFSCERYDHDFGGWVDDVSVGLHLIDDDEVYRIYELEKRVAELTNALNQTVNGYKSCLRTGHERIVELGGECDEPETMIAQNPDIRHAEKVLAAGINLETGGEA
ncbi:ead/Ea22-like family protein [Cronobacter turicensis]|uniref:ead/Ea22-like family protein n=1 Tax=Cronobacter turicensis TaxID=413502 RepID=UPI0011ADD57E|nr:ead/Ea22-like family protein [Cronobacter turicensis]TWR31853.1 hypothetical protein FQY85_20400 [Cronobacter turicensis]